MPNLQENIFSSLENAIGTNVSLTKWLSETLEIDYSVAYRKVMGRSRLQLDHLARIIQEHPKLIDCLLGGHTQGEFFVGKYNCFHGQSELIGYLRGMHEALTEGCRRAQYFQYVTHDFPLMLFLKGEMLLDYKLSTWLNTLEKNGIESHSSEVHQLAKEIGIAYTQLDSEEIWCRDLLQNQLRQIEWHEAYGAITAAQSGVLRAELRSILEEVEQWSARGNKLNGQFNLMISSFNTMNNGGVLINEKEGTLLFNFNGVSHTATSRHTLIKSFRKQFEGLKSCSVSVSKVNAMARTEFFQNLQACL